MIFQIWLIQSFPQLNHLVRNGEANLPTLAFESIREPSVGDEIDSIPATAIEWRTEEERRGDV